MLEVTRVAGSACGVAYCDGVGTAGGVGSVGFDGAAAAGKRSCAAGECHGGGGITLSWGTSHLARELATETQHKRCAILGCGAAGLSAARLMQNAGWEVSIYAKDLPPNTTSNIAKLFDVYIDFLPSKCQFNSF